MNRPVLTTTSREIIENLSSELDKLYLRSQMPKSSSDLDLHDDETECDYFGDLEERLTGKKGMKRPQCLGDSIPGGPSRPYDEFPIETPASPSAAGIVLPSNCSNRSRHSSGTVTGDGHQLYFDAETGEDMLTRHHADGSSSRKGLVKDDSSGISSSGNSETVHPTHRATHRFVKRHEDEISMEVGDPIYVEEEAEDLWCTGVNLRSGARGTFPIVYVFEIDFEEECGPISALQLNTQEKATFYITYLG